MVGRGGGGTLGSGDEYVGGGGGGVRWGMVVREGVRRGWGVRDGGT